MPKCEAAIHKLVVISLNLLSFPYLILTNFKGYICFRERKSKPINLKPDSGLVVPLVSGKLFYPVELIQILVPIERTTMRKKLF